MTSNIDIKLTSQFTGKKAFKEAESSISKLGTSAKNLAKTFGVSLAAAAFVKYSKAAMNAAAQDQKSQALLANSLNNLGLAYAKVDVEGFISKLESQSAIADDVLRPAFAQLAQVTGSVGKSQEMMKLAFDVSAGSGLSYASTIDILSQAYVGNYKGLKQLNLGLTQGELAGMRYEDVQKKIQATYSGAGASSLETYRGQMDKLTIATGNASEKIGYALLDAIIKVSGSKDVDGLVTKINALASAFASVVTQVGNAVAALTGNETQKAFSPGFAISGGRAGTFTVPKTGLGNMPLTGGSNMDTQRFMIAEAKKAEEAAIKRQKELLAIENARIASQKKMIENAKKAQLEAQKKLVLDKASAFLTQAQRIFDMDRIQLAAAALSKQSEEDKVRIRLKQELLDLEDAINSGNIEASIKLAASVAKDAELLGQLRGKMIALGDVPDPFAEWLNSIQAILAALIAIANYKPPTSIYGVPGTLASQGNNGMGFGTGNFGPGNIPGLSGESFGMGGYTLPQGQHGVQNISVVVNNAGSTITERDLVSSITQGIYNNQAAGIPISYSTAF